MTSQYGMILKSSPLNELMTFSISLEHRSLTVIDLEGITMMKLNSFQVRYRLMRALVDRLRRELQIFKY